MGQLCARTRVRVALVCLLLGGCATGQGDDNINNQTGPTPDGAVPAGDGSTPGDGAVPTDASMDDVQAMPTDVDTSGMDVTPGADTGAADTGQGMDSGTAMDTGVDTGPVDTGVIPPMDTGVDTGPVDTGVIPPTDTGVPVDTGVPADTGSGGGMTCPVFPISTQRCRPTENCCATVAVAVGCGCAIPLIGTCIPRGGPGC